jgi:hypothetical protein
MHFALLCFCCAGRLFPVQHMFKWLCYGNGEVGSSNSPAAGALALARQTYYCNITLGAAASSMHVSLSIVSWLYNSQQAACS